MAQNKPTQIDPTLNVRELINEAVQRVDDLATARGKHIEDKIHDKDIQYQLQFTSAKESVGIALVAQEKAVAAALEGTREAINKADVNTDKRFSLLSEKIDGITSTISKSTGERGIYVTHADLSDEMEKLRNSFETMLRPVVTFMNSQTGQQRGVSASWGVLLGAVGLISGLIGIFFALR